MKRFEYSDCNLRGRIKRIDYITKDEDGCVLKKYVNVYLPYGYDADDTDKKYDVLYLSHGGGGNSDAWLDSCAVKNMLDISFSKEGVDSFIVVFMSYYKSRHVEGEGLRMMANEREKVKAFQHELVHDLIPAVEESFNTYSESTSSEDLKLSRDHRAIGGFSMGAGLTWFAFTQNFDYFSKFIPLSGDCWELEVMGGFSKPRKTVDFLCEYMSSHGIAKSDFKILTATGTKDIAYHNVDNQVQEMKKHSEFFSDENFEYILAEGEEHTYDAVLNYLYSFIASIF